MALNDNQQKAAELYVQGTTITDIAKIVGVSRPTIYDWLKIKDMKATIDELTTEIKNQAEKKISSKLDNYLSELEKIALTSKSEKIKVDSLTYLIDRVMGKSTTKIEDVTDSIDKDLITSDELVDELTKFRVVKKAE